MATFGYTTAGSGSGGYLVNGKLTSRATLSEDADSVTKVTAYIRNDGIACNARCAIYADSSGPAALMGQTNQVAIGESAAAAWVDFSFATPFSLSAGTYWIAIFADGGNVRIYHDSVGGASTRYGDDTYSDGFEDPFGPSDFADEIVGSYYATYSTAVSTNFQVNIGDSWKAAGAVSINIGDSWKAVASASVNIGDAWKTIF